MKKNKNKNKIMSILLATTLVTLGGCANTESNRDLDNKISLDSDVSTQN